MRQMSGGQFNIPIVFRGPTASAGQLAVPTLKLLRIGMLTAQG